jgi:Flp pilus assembly protein TadD
LDEASRCFDQAITLNPKADNAYVGKGSVARKRNDIPAARAQYTKALEILPNDPQALSSMVAIEIIEGNYAEAVRYGEAAWKQDQSSATIAANLSVAYHYIGDIAARDRYFQHARKLEYALLGDLEDIFAGRSHIPRQSKP